MKQIRTKVVKDKVQLYGEGYPVGSVQEMKIWSYNQILLARTRIRQRERDAWLSLVQQLGKIIETSRIF